MNAHVPDHLMESLSDWVSRNMGLYFPRARWDDLHKGIIGAAQEFGCSSPVSCIEWLLETPLQKDQIEILAGQLTIGETYFLRERPAFTMLEEHILPELIQARRSQGRRLRFWSVACCTGEEPYSIAMTVHRLLPDWRDWNITILATDINPRFLAKAKAGLYGAWSFREVSEEIKNTYFKRHSSSSYEVVPEIKSMVTFDYHNLVESSPFSDQPSTDDMDIIFCRNVLMYFDRQKQLHALERLRESLREGGWLVPGLSEISDVFGKALSPVRLPEIVVYRKAFSTIGVPPVGGTGISSIMPWEPEPSVMNALFKQTRESYPNNSPGSNNGADRSNQWEPRTNTPLLSPRAKEEKKILSAAADSDDLNKQAVEWFEKGEYDEVIHALKNKQASNDLPASALVLLARSHANLGQLAEAATWIEKAIAVGKMDPKSHYIHSVILQELDQMDAAVAALNRALYLDPEFIMAHVARAQIAAQQQKSAIRDKDYANALNLLKRLPADALVPESDGMTAGRLVEMILKLRG